MKKSLFAMLITMSGSIPFAYSQNNDRLTMDSAVRYGKLPNGLTYYIRHNNFPEGYADFQIFHSVGAIQEEANQNGLAHFLEHQAFKGLKRLPGKTMTNYLESIGVKFGANLNAATTTDYTRYMINQVPVNRKGIIDTCLLILSDWSGSILASQEDIDTERGVIKEEWRMRGGVDLRANTALAPFYFRGSRYAERSVIGDMKIIETFRREELMDFYHKWYRPEYQAVAIVGDFDVDAMEAQVKKVFSTLRNLATSAPKLAYPLPANKELIYGTYHDREASGTSVSLLFKHRQPLPDKRVLKATFSESYIRNLAIAMMNARWQEISDKKDFPLKVLNYGYGSFAADQDVFGISADIKPGGPNIEPALNMMLEESERIRRFGFNQTELEITRANFRRRAERNFRESDKKTNTSFVDAFMNHFLENEPVQSASAVYRLVSDILDTVSLNTVNEAAKKMFTEQNRIMTIVCSDEDSASLPTEQYVTKKLAKLPYIALTPYASKKHSQLVPVNNPAAGKVVHTEKALVGSIVWTLSNGVKVHVLPTPHKKDEILMAAFKPGGHSVLSDKDFVSARLLSSALTSSGVGKLNSTELNNALAGKIVYVTPYFGELWEGFDCATTPSDFETTVRLMYMYLTEPRFNEADFSIEMKKLKENLAARKKNPFSSLQDSVTYWRSNHHFRASNLILDTTTVNKIDFNRLRELYKQRFGNPGDFTYVITGAIDTAAVRPIIEKYIGSLKRSESIGKWQDVGKRPPVGVKKVDFKQKMETPKSTTFIEYTKLAPYTYRRMTAMQLLQGILDIRFNKLLRDEKSGVYSTAIEASNTELPVSRLSVIVSFETDPPLMDELSAIVHRELKRLVTEGVDAADLAKSLEFMQKSIAQRRTNNYYWHSVINTFARNGRDIFTGSEELPNQIDAGEITALLKELIYANNVLSVTMRPE